MTAYAEAVVGGAIVAGPYVRAACQRHLNDLSQGPMRGLVWNVADAERVIGYHPDVLTVEVERRDEYGENESLVVPFRLEPWQCFIVGSLFGWRTKSGFRRFRRAFIEVGKGNGKALAIDTPIATPSGWTAMGDLEPGDKVFDETGQVCNVTAVSGHMIGRPCFSVKFSDGDEIIADAEHLWRTSSLRSGGAKGPKPADHPRKGQYSLRTTAEIASTLTTGQTSSLHPQAKWNHRVDVCGALDLPDADLPIGPYTLGAWLGDGDSDCARLTVAYADWDIVEEIRKEGYSADERAKHSVTTARVAIGQNQSLQSKLRALNLLGNKHIPPAYFRGSKVQRMRLLHGLMDTDGSALKDGAAEFTSCKESLSREVCSLLRTLGFKPTISEADAVLNGRAVGKRWRVRVHAYVDNPIFCLARKAARQKPRPRSRSLSLGRMIVGCAPVASVPVQCISVDSPSRMFLAGRHLVPTHNSPMAAGIGHYMLTALRKIRAEIYAAATDKDQAAIMFRDAVAMWDRSPALKRRLIASGINPVWQLTNLETASFFKPISSEKKGKSGIRPFCGLIDEVHEHRDNSVIEMLRAGTKGNQDALLLEITNSGFDRNSVCGSEHQYSIEVVTGLKDNDAWFAYVCALDDDDDPFEDESCWVKANPNLGISIHPPFIREQVAEAKGMPSKEGLVRRLHFCQWTDSESSAIPRKVWDRCLAKPGEIVPEELCEKYGRPFGGLDLSRAIDFVAFTLTWLTDPTPDAWRFVSKTWFWTPRDTLADRARIDRAPYVEWEKAGYIETTPGKRVSYKWVADALAGLCTAYSPQAIGCDQYGLERLEEALQDIGVTLPCVVHPQGFQPRVIDKKEQPREHALIGGTGTEKISIWMPDSILKFEAALLEQRILIDPNPMQTMGAASVIYAENRTGFRMFAKDKATNRIDGMVSNAMSIGMATLKTAAKPYRSYLESGSLAIG